MILQAVSNTLKTTVFLFLPPAVIAYFVGSLLGIYFSKKGIAGRFVRYTSLFFYSIPVFWLAIIVVIFTFFTIYFFRRYFD